MIISMLFGPDSFLSRLGDIALLLLVLFLCYALTEKYLSRFIKVDYSSPIEKFVFLEGLGLGVLAYSTLVLGLCGLLYRWVFCLILLLAIYLAKDSFQKLFDLLKTVKIEPSLILKYKLEASIVLLFLVFAVVHLIAALCPPISWDELWYHLAVPKLYIQHRRMFNFTPMMETKYIMTQEMLYLAGMLLKSDILAKLFHFSMGMLVSIAIYSFSRNYFSRQVGLLAALIFYSTPIVAWESTAALVELGLTFFEFLAVYAVIKWFISKDNKWLVLGAVFTGLAMGSKYLAFFSLFSVILLIIFEIIFTEKESKIDLLRPLAVFLGITLLVSCVWYIRNYFYTGNPVFPLMNNIFRSDQWFPVFSRSMPGVPSNMSEAKSILYYLRLPWSLTFGSDPRKEQQIGPIFLMFLPLLCLFIMCNKEKISKPAKYIMAYCALFFFFWGMTRSSGRYLIPLLPFLSILSSHAVFKMAAYLNKLTSRILLVFILMVILMNLPFFTPFWLKGYETSHVFPDLDSFMLSIKTSFGVVDREYYLSTNVRAFSPHGYPAIGFMNRVLSPSARILTFTIMPYYFERESLDAIGYYPAYGRSLVEVLSLEDEDIFLKALKDLKITHLAFNTMGPLPVNDNIINDKIEGLTRKRNIGLIYDQKGIKIYSVDIPPKDHDQYVENSEAKDNIRKYEGILKSNPKDIDARLELAAAHATNPNMWDNNFNLSVREYEYALKLDPENTTAYIGLGHSLWLKELCYNWSAEYSEKLRGYRSAVDSFRKALELDPGNLEAVIGMTNIYRTSDKFIRELEWGLKTIRQAKGDNVLLVTPLPQACAFIFLHKLTLILGIILAGLVTALVFIRNNTHKDLVVLATCAIWIVIVFINFYPKLFIPFCTIYLSFL